MKKLYTLLMLIPLLASAQVTINVTSIPSNTPDGALIYLAGSVNSWYPSDPNYVLNDLGNGTYQIIIPEGTGTVQYKFTRGSWPTVEGSATGGFIPDRSFSFTGAPQTLNLTILSWEDLGGGTGSTAANNVSVLNGAFYMPQLNTTRRVWLYLPPDYATSTKNYPVLYMHDGQNVFDSATSFSGEWEVDETLNNLFANGDYGAIVVAIDNGGASRLDEYSPWVNSAYGGGDGDAYIEFIAETLKPFIDANYRTRPEPAFTALIGSSMGGLISTYGAIERGDVFRKVGAMSPSYWFALSNLQNYISTSAGSLADHRIYFVAGSNESATMTQHIDLISNLLATKGLLSVNTVKKYDSFGTHSEAYWRGEFGAMYQWLFANETLSVVEDVKSKVAIRQLFSGEIQVVGIDSVAVFSVFNVAGAHVRDVTLTNGMNRLPENLPRGIYILKSRVLPIAPIRVVR